MWGVHRGGENGAQNTRQSQGGRSLGCNGGGGKGRAGLLGPGTRVPTLPRGHVHMDMP